MAEGAPGSEGKLKGLLSLMAGDCGHDRQSLLSRMSHLTGATLGVWSRDIFNSRFIIYITQSIVDRLSEIRSNENTARGKA